MEYFIFLSFWTVIFQLSCGFDGAIAAATDLSRCKRWTCPLMMISSLSPSGHTSSKPQYPVGTCAPLSPDGPLIVPGRRWLTRSRLQAISALIWPGSYFELEDEPDRAGTHERGADLELVVIWGGMRPADAPGYFEWQLGGRWVEVFEHLNWWVGLLLLTEWLSSESSLKSSISCLASSRRCCFTKYISFLALRASWATTRYSFSMRSCSCRHWVRGFSIWVVSEMISKRSHNAAKQRQTVNKLPEPNWIHHCLRKLIFEELKEMSHCWCGRCSTRPPAGHKPPPIPEAVHRQHSRRTSAVWWFWSRSQKQHIRL